MALISNQKTYESINICGKYTVKVVDERKLKPIYMRLMGDTLQTEKNIQTEGVVVEKKVIIRKRKPKESWVTILRPKYT